MIIIITEALSELKIKSYNPCWLAQLVRALSRYAKVAGSMLRAHTRNNQ